MLAIDRKILDTPLDDRLQSRTTDLVAWSKTMLPVIHQSISEAKEQIRTGHQDIRDYCEPTVPPTATTVMIRTNNRLLARKRRSQKARTQKKTRSSDIRQHASPTSPTTMVRNSTRLIASKRRSQNARTLPKTISTDIRQYFPGRNSTS